MTSYYFLKIYRGARNRNSKLETRNKMLSARRPTPDARRLTSDAP